MRNIRHASRLALLWILCASVASAQTKPADDRAAVIGVARAFISATRAEDKDALTKLFAIADDATAGRLRDAIWMAVEVQKLRLAAERAFGPEPKPGIENDDWNWGVPPVEYFDVALEREPTIIQIEGDRATIWAYGMPPLARQADGRWLFVPENDGEVTPAPTAELRAALELRFSEIHEGIESGQIKRAGDIPGAVISLFLAPATTRPGNAATQETDTP